MGNFTVDEDCLTLNVWSPVSASKLPVYVFIYGGGYIEGCSAEPLYDGRAMATSGNVVVVTMNYRVGAMGFLAGGELTGNYGIMDQQAAFMWVQQNIAAFGGDPTRVTIGGQSAGGMSVATHLTLPSTQVLKPFQAAVIQSDPVIMLYRTMTEQQPLYDAFTQAIGCGVASSRAACLRALPWKTIIDYQDDVLWPLAYNLTWRGVIKKLPFQPTLDGTFLLQNPWDAFSSGNFYKVPVMIGTVANETMGFIGAMEGNYPGIPWILDGFYMWGLDILFGSSIADQVRMRYPGIPTGLDAVSRAATDFVFVCPTLQSANWLSKYVPTYVYQMTHVPNCDPENWEWKLCRTKVCHSADMVFDFHSIAVDREGDCTWSTLEDQLSWNMLYALTNFTTNPQSFKSMPAWTSSSAVTNFDIPIKTSNSLLQRSHCDFWFNLYSRNLN